MGLKYLHINMVISILFSYYIYVSFVLCTLLSISSKSLLSLVTFIIIHRFLKLWYQNIKYFKFNDQRSQFLVLKISHISRLIIKDLRLWYQNIKYSNFNDYRSQNMVSKMTHISRLTATDLEFWYQSILCTCNTTVVTSSNIA